MRLPLLVLILAITLSGQTWQVSIAVLGGASALELHSSLGALETHPWFQQTNGRFASRKAIATQAAIVGGLALSEWLVLRATHGRGRRAFVAVNLVLATKSFALATRNGRQR